MGGAAPQRMDPRPTFYLRPTWRCLTPMSAWQLWTLSVQTTQMPKNFLTPVTRGSSWIQFHLGYCVLVVLARGHAWWVVSLSLTLQTVFWYFPGWQWRPPDPWEHSWSEHSYWLLQLGIRMCQGDNTDYIRNIFLFIILFSSGRNLWRIYKSFPLQSLDRWEDDKPAVLFWRGRCMEYHIKDSVALTALDISSRIFNWFAYWQWLLWLNI